MKKYKGRPEKTRNKTNIISNLKCYVGLFDGLCVNDPSCEFWDAKGCLYGLMKNCINEKLAYGEYNGKCPHCTSKLLISINGVNAVKSDIKISEVTLK